ncbi:MAG: hemolysin family protein [Clostridiales bacterium]|nr:hemolysin family protein [Clostridiales bacterium]
MLHALILLAGFLLLTALWTLAEAAFAALDKSELREKAADGDRRAMRIKSIVDDMDFFQSMLRMAVVLTWAAFGALIFVFPQRAAISAGVLAGGAAIALFLGNILKTMAINHAYAMAGAILPVLRLFLLPLFIFVRFFAFLSHVLMRRFGVDATRPDLGVSEDDIRSMVNRGGDVGSIDASEQAMINNIFEFNDKSAYEIATHRTEMVAIDVDAGREEVVNTIVEHELSRYPVYEGEIDNIVGILYVKDIMTHIFTSKDLRDDFDLRELMKEPYKVPSFKKIDDIFEEMRKSKMHMAIVFDEYGGCEGLLTVEDLIEEIVGNIYDEYDEIEVPDIEEIGNDKYMIQGIAEPEDVAKALGIALPEEEFDTFGGFVVNLLGRIPDDGEKPGVSHGGYLFQVYEVREKRIQSVFAERE